MYDRQIFVTFQFEGEHAWFGAPKEVAFLRNLHRHMFHVRVDISVGHSDREIEFILFKRELQSLYSDFQKCSYKSCEMLCEDLGEYLLEHYPNHSFRIEISEDGENGSVLQYDHSEKT